MGKKTRAERLKTAGTWFVWLGGAASVVWLGLSLFVFSFARWDDSGRDHTSEMWAGPVVAVLWTGFFVAWRPQSSRPKAWVLGLMSFVLPSIIAFALNPVLFGAFTKLIIPTSSTFVVGALESDIPFGFSVESTGSAGFDATSEAPRSSAAAICTEVGTWAARHGLDQWYVTSMSDESDPVPTPLAGHESEAQDACVTAALEGHSLMSWKSASATVDLSPGDPWILSVRKGEFAN